MIVIGGKSFWLVNFDLLVNSPFKALRVFHVKGFHVVIVYNISIAIGIIANEHGQWKKWFI